MDEIYFSVEEDDADSEINRKWVYYAPVYRLDEMRGYIIAHCLDAVEDKWMVDMSAFRSGMAMEATYMGSIAAWATVMSIHIDQNVPRIYQMVLAASRGELSLDEILKKLQDELWNCEFKMDISRTSDKADLNGKSKSMKNVLKEPGRWWISLAPGFADTSERSRQYVDYAQAVDYVRNNPNLVEEGGDPADREVLQVLEEASEVLQALEQNQTDQLRRLEGIISNDDKELVRLFKAAYPHASNGAT